MCTYHGAANSMCTTANVLAARAYGLNTTLNIANSCRGAVILVAESLSHSNTSLLTLFATQAIPDRNFVVERAKTRVREAGVSQAQASLTCEKLWTCRGRLILPTWIQ